jgi:hypothetical protein
MRGLLTLSLGSVLLLGACSTTMQRAEDPNRTSAIWPAPVVQGLPANVPDDAVVRDSDGCYAYRDPAAMSGYQVIIGIDGRQVCDGRFADPVEIAALAAEARSQMVFANTGAPGAP